MFEVPEGNKLDDVSENSFSSGWTQDPSASVQHLHVTEVSIPDTDDDDGHGETGGLDDGLSRVGHVSNDAVSQDEEDEVLLSDRIQKKPFALHLNSGWDWDFNMMILWL